MILALSASDVQIGWKIFFGLAAIFLVVRLALYLSTGWKGFQRWKVIQAEIERKMAEIQNMDVQTAKPLGMQVFNDAATNEPWRGPIPNELVEIIGNLDDSIQSLFRVYRKWSFRATEIETETDFSAEYLLSKPLVEGAYLIGMDNFQHKLVVKPKAPTVLELNENDRVVEKYSTIYHYFLLAQGEYF